ncbi:MAG: septal ring lytic transglycosylase RlpA family protein [Bacteroidetes bacterium]|nr:septal ring lytic transglycosylase RlpA family protein [Bacteroidota bacterium]
MRQIVLFILLAISFSAKAQEAAVPADIDEAVKKGVASYYHDKFEGRKTATGEIFDNDKFTAASNKLKLGSYVKVTNVSNDEVVYVKINDRMAANNKRLIDLASIAAKKLHFAHKGITKVKVEVVSEEEGRVGILAQNVSKEKAPKNTL